MERYEPVAMVQQVEREDDHFDPAEFKRLLSELDSKEFNKFCKRILYLTHFHDSNVGAICTDQVNDFKDPDGGWELK